MGKTKAKSSPELNVMLEEMENIGYVRSFVISNGCLVSVKIDMHRLTLGIHLHISSTDNQIRANSFR